MKLRIEKSVVVITPTIGSPKLADAITSVENQTYGNLRL
jgi:glycosyltransferase involved in cell wall biosynthesis